MDGTDSVLEGLQIASYEEDLPLEDYLVDSSSDDPAVDSKELGSIPSSSTRRIKFSKAQKSCLEAYYKMGMTSTGKKQSSLISRAVEDTQLSSEQVKRWIKKKRYIRNQVAKKTAKVDIQKNSTLTAWQIFLKEFGESEVGQKALSNGIGTFNKAASEAYKVLDCDERIRLKVLSSQSRSQTSMTLKQIRVAGSQIFRKIQKQFKKLEEIGYRGVAFGFFDDDVQTVYTKECACCINQTVIEYIRAVTIAGNPPQMPASINKLEEASMSGVTSPDNRCMPSFSMAADSSLPKPVGDSQVTSHPKKRCVPSNSSVVADRASLIPKPIEDSQAIISHPKKRCVPTNSSVAADRSRSSLVPKPGGDSQVMTISHPKKQCVPSSVAAEGSSSSSLPKTIDIDLLTETSHSEVLPKDGTTSWLPHLGLDLREKQILESQAWLNDKIMGAASVMLKTQSKGKVFGWESTLCCNKVGMFQLIPPDSLFVQFLFFNESHWVTVSNIDVTSLKPFPGTVNVYDSGRCRRISPLVRKMICSFFKSRLDTIRFDIMNVQGQPNSYNCGLYAIGFATELVYNCDPVLCNFEDGKMRCHLMECFEKGVISRFPTRGVRRIQLGMKTLNTIVDKVYCICKMPNDKERPMVKCGTCLKWYHGECLLIDCEHLTSTKWVCDMCQEYLNNLEK